MRFSLNKFFIALVSVPAALAAVNGRCSSGNGVCVSTSSCSSAGGTYKSNLCPNDPANVKCCNKSCKVNGVSGTCKFTSSCTGTSYAGYCPGGSNFQCCIPKASSGSSGSSSPKGTSIVNYAKKFIGNPYVYGGNSLTNGIDCSGFTQQIFKHFGISLPRTSKEQAKAGKAVSSLSQAKPADLTFYCSDGTVTHVAIYEGNNRIVHASNKKDGIKESNANYQKPCHIRRFI